MRFVFLSVFVFLFFHVSAGELLKWADIEPLIEELRFIQIAESANDESYFSAKSGSQLPEMDFSVEAGFKEIDNVGKKPHWSVSASQSFLGFMKYSGNTKAADSKKNAAKVRLIYEKNEMKISLKEKYNRISFLLEEKKIAEENSKELTDLFNVVNEKVKNGIARNSESTRLFVEKEKAIDAVSAIESEIKSLSLELHSLMNGKIPASFVTEALSYNQKTFSDPFSVKNHYLILENTYEKKSAVFQKNNSIYEYIPDFSIGVLYGKEYETATFAISVGLTLPIWNLSNPSRKSSQALITRLNIEEVELSQNLLSERKILINNLNHLEKRINRYAETIIPASKKSAVESKTLYLAGEENLSAVIETFVTAQSTLSEYLSLVTMYQNIVDVIKFRFGEENE